MMFDQSRHNRHGDGIVRKVVVKENELNVTDDDYHR
jgi:hypothetical protein